MIPFQTKQEFINAFEAAAFTNAELISTLALIVASPERETFAFVLCKSSKAAYNPVRKTTSFAAILGRQLKNYHFADGSERRLFEEIERGVGYGY
jgi:hypothetical protein